MDWHPRSNARPTRWTCSAGRWARVYGIVEQVDVHRNMLWTAVYLATAVSKEGVRTNLGEFPTGDAAVEALWDAYMNDIKPLPAPVG